VKTLVDETFPSESHVLDRKEKTGITYIRTEVATGRKLHLLKSTGKHLNAVMSFLEWFGEHAKRLIEKRDMTLNQHEKLSFFEALEGLAGCDQSRLEMMKMSDMVKSKLCSTLFNDRQVKEVLADLILISINKNQSNVKAIAGNYRKCIALKKTTGAHNSGSKKKKDDIEVDVPDVDEIGPVTEQFSDVEPDSE
jgi:hypothetical protein